MPAFHTEGGAATAVTANQREELGQSGPVFLPDGRHFLYRRTVRLESSGIFLGSLDDKPQQQSSRRLVATDYVADFVPSPDGSSGEILFLREGTLFAQRFDLGRLEVNGEAVCVATPQRVALDSAGNLFIVDRKNNRIRKVTPDGMISTFAGNGVAGFSGDGGRRP